MTVDWGGGGVSGGKSRRRGGFINKCRLESKAAAEFAM